MTWNVWAIFDSGASATLTDPFVFDHLEGDLVKRNFQVQGISGCVQETDTAKKVKVLTIQGQAEILIWTLQIGGSRYNCLNFLSFVVVVYSCGWLPQKILWKPLHPV